MKTYNTKKINLFFTFDSEGNVIEGSKFVGVTYLDEDGQRFEPEGKRSSLAVQYEQMTIEQKEAFDTLIESYVNLKDQ